MTSAVLLRFPCVKSDTKSNQITQLIIIFVTYHHNNYIVRFVYCT